MLGCTQLDDLAVPFLRELCPPPHQVRSSEVLSVSCKRCGRKFSPSQWERLSQHRCRSKVIKVKLTPPSSDELEQVLLDALEVACCASEASFEAAAVALAASSAACATQKLKAARQKRIEASKKKKSGYLSPIKVISRQIENVQAGQVVTDQVWSRLDKPTSQLEKEISKDWESVRSQMRKSSPYQQGGLNQSQSSSPSVSAQTPSRQTTSPTFYPSSPIFASTFDDSNVDAKIAAQRTTPSSVRRVSIVLGNDGNSNSSNSKGSTGKSKGKKSIRSGRARGSKSKSGGAGGKTNARRQTAAVSQLGGVVNATKAQVQVQAQAEVDSPAYLASAKPRLSVTATASQALAPAPAPAKAQAQTQAQNPRRVSVIGMVAASPVGTSARRASRRATVTAVRNVSGGHRPGTHAHVHAHAAPSPVSLDVKPTATAAATTATTATPPPPPPPPPPPSSHRSSAAHDDERGSEWTVTPELFDLRLVAEQALRGAHAQHQHKHKHKQPEPEPEHQQQQQLPEQATEDSIVMHGAGGDSGNDDDDAEFV